VLDHVSGEGIGTFLAQVVRVLKPGGVLMVDIDAHAPDSYAVSTHAQVAAAVSRGLAASGLRIEHSRPFCRTESEWMGQPPHTLAVAVAQRSWRNTTCVLGNPTSSGGFDPAGGTSLIARKPRLAV
jgi:hypothetical protein